MVHQLSLVSSIPHNKYVQTVSTLQALTGLTSPQEISTYTLVTRPHNTFKPKFEPGKVNQIEQYYMKCTTIWSDEASKKFDLAIPLVIGGDNDNVLVDRLFSGEEQVERNWTLQISDIPVAGKNQVCSAQTIYESTLAHTRTISRENKPVKEEVNGEASEPSEPSEIKQEDIEMKDVIDLSGEKEEPMVVDVEENDKKDKEVKQEENIKSDGENIKSEGAETKTQGGVRETTPLPPKRDSFLQFLEDLGYDVINQYWIKGVRFCHKDIVIEIFKIFIRDDTAEYSNKDKIKLKLLDDTNTLQIKAYINIPKATDVELINQGTKDLLRLQEFLKNLFVLETPDRMFMDSRVLKTN